MKKNLIISILSFILLLSLFGCGDSTQREVIHALFKPFSLPDNSVLRKEFRAQVIERAGADPDSGIIEYKFVPLMIRETKNDFCDSICARIICLINDPNLGTLVLGEDWYYSLETIEPLLLRRRVLSEEKKDYILESWAIETKLNANQILDPTWTTPVLKAKSVPQAGQD